VVGQQRGQLTPRPGIATTQGRSLTVMMKSTVRTRCLGCKETSEVSVSTLGSRITCKRCQARYYFATHDAFDALSVSGKRAVTCRRCKHEEPVDDMEASHGWCPVCNYWCNWDYSVPIPKCDRSGHREGYSILVGADTDRGWNPGDACSVCGDTNTTAPSRSVRADRGGRLVPIATMSGFKCYRCNYEVQRVEWRRDDGETT